MWPGNERLVCAMMKKQTYRMGVFALLFTVILSASSLAATKLTLFGWGDAVAQETYRQFVEAFMVQNPQYEVEMIPFNGNYVEKVLLMAAAGETPDVVMVDSSQYIEFIESGVLYDISVHLQNDPVFQARKADIFPKLLDVFTYKGKIYGLPKDASPRVFYYNMDLFDYAGLPYPSATWTWQDFLDLSRKLTRRDADGRAQQFGFAGATISPPSTWVEWIRGAGGDITDQIINPSRSTMSSPAAREGLNFLISLMYPLGVAPRSGEKAAFATGDVGMMSNWRASMLTLLDAKFRWDLAIPPQGKDRKFSLATVSYSVSTASKHKEGAYELVRFLSTDPISQRLHGATGNAVPNLRSIASSSDFLQKPVRVNNRVFLHVMEYVELVYPMTLHWS